MPKAGQPPLNHYSGQEVVSIRCDGHSEDELRSCTGARCALLAPRVSRSIGCLIDSFIPHLGDLLDFFHVYLSPAKKIPLCLVSLLAQDLPLDSFLRNGVTFFDFAPDCIFLYFAKALDRVHHSLLLHKISVFA